MRKLKELGKTIPALKSVVRTIRNVVFWLRYQSIIPKLYPVSTDVHLIRLGPNGDGGYLIPDDLNGISACFSPGVSAVSGFEKDCADRGMNVYLADASVDAPTESHHLFEFSKKFIGGCARENFITLEQWVAESSEDTSSDFMMQMDIEGFEYEALRVASKKLINFFRIIVIEFHNLDCLDKDKFRILNKLMETHYCVHIHPNNCCGSVRIFNLEIPKVMEFTFLRKDRIKNLSYRCDFPHELDFDNTPRPPLELPVCWYYQK